MGVNINDILAEHGIELSPDELAHYGKRGMKWGKRKHATSSDAHADPPKPHVKSMTDSELKTAIARIKMEQEFTKLSAPHVSTGRKIVSEILLDVGKQQAKIFLSNAATAAIAGGGLQGSLRTASGRGKAAAKPDAPAQRQKMQFTPVADWQK